MQAKQMSLQAAIAINHEWTWCQARSVSRPPIPKCFVHILYGEHVFSFLCTISHLDSFRTLSDRSGLLHAKKPDALNHSFVATATCTTLPSVSLIHLALLLRLSNHSAQRSFSLSLATILPLQVRTMCSSMSQGSSPPHSSHVISNQVASLSLIRCP